MGLTKSIVERRPTTRQICIFIRTKVQLDCHSMKILQTATAYYPSVGGAQLHWYTIAKMLLGRGHELVVASQWKDQRNRYLLDSTLTAPLGDDDYIVSGIQVHRFQPALSTRLWMAPLLPLCFIFPALGYAPISAYFTKRFKEINFRSDIVHNIRIGREHYSWASYHTARRLGVPFCITPNYSPRMQSPLGKVVMRNFFKLLRLSDGVFVFTEAEREEMMLLGVPPDNICLIGVGPLLSTRWNADGFKKCYNINGNMILFLGQKLQYKGFDVLVDAAKFVWQKHPDTSFVFIGPHYDNSKAIIEHLNDPRIVDIPRVDVFDPIKASALAACDVFALPSSQEGIGGVYIEAWAMKKPVIGCRIPFVAIRDEDDGFLVEQDARALAQKINWLLDHPVAAAEMGLRGYARVEKEYSWESIVDKVEGFYRMLLERS